MSERTESIRKAVKREWLTSYEIAKPLGVRSGDVEIQMKKLEKFGIVEKRRNRRPSERQGRPPTYEWRLVQ